MSSLWDFYGLYRESKVFVLCYSSAYTDLSTHTTASNKAIRCFAFTLKHLIFVAILAILKD